MLIKANAPTLYLQIYTLINKMSVVTTLWITSSTSIVNITNNLKLLKSLLNVLSLNSWVIKYTKVWFPLRSHCALHRDRLPTYFQNFLKVFEVTLGFVVKHYIGIGLYLFGLNTKQSLCSPCWILFKWFLVPPIFSNVQFKRGDVLVILQNLQKIFLESIASK